MLLSDTKENSVEPVQTTLNSPGYLLTTPVAVTTHCPRNSTGVESATCYLISTISILTFFPSPQGTLAMLPEHFIRGCVRDP